MRHEPGRPDGHGGNSRYILGCGETFQQLQQRLLRDKEAKIRRALERLGQKRQLLGRQRCQREFQVVSVVGYTNCVALDLAAAAPGLAAPDPAALGRAALGLAAPGLATPSLAAAAPGLAALTPAAPGLAAPSLAAAAPGLAAPSLAAAASGLAAPDPAAPGLAAPSLVATYLF
uniref:Uncharacterized protein n=1 Tax=Pipistrellus kuhlii TaxID=59472 RepID=A0A7J7QWF0_PIPKU|nr:hypothetical protein mPipKuh1_008333 [Pipistrellus kuhlii]